jgi:hypothetical protein
VLVVSQTAESSYRPTRENRSQNTEPNIYVMEDKHLKPEPVLVKISTSDTDGNIDLLFNTSENISNYYGELLLKTPLDTAAYMLPKNLLPNQDKKVFDPAF